MGKNKNKPINKKMPCEDAFLTNPVVSANDCTGYVVKVPTTDEAAKSYSDLCDVPVTKSKIKK